MIELCQKKREAKNAEGMGLKSLHVAPSIAAFASIALDKCDKFAWSKFEQPIGWPAGRKPWMVFVQAQETGGMQGGFFFGYFLLATQKKVSRLSVREPTFKKVSRSVPYKKISNLSSFNRYSMGIKGFKTMPSARLRFASFQAYPAFNPKDRSI